MQVARTIARNVVASAVALAYDLTAMATVVVAMEAEFGMPRNTKNHAR